MILNDSPCASKLIVIGAPESQSGASTQNAVLLNAQGPQYKYHSVQPSAPSSCSIIHSAIDFDRLCLSLLGTLQHWSWTHAGWTP